jgi:redox-sensitive bicupin YhaK (pirin superfamily)
MKSVLGVYSAPRGDWVGDGFPVRTLFSYDSHARHLSPFLMLDYAGPAQFAAGGKRRGVGEHPHRGFETVTIIYQGEVDHRDSGGGGGHIGPGDVQWMTAGAGVVHDEFHSDAFTRAGGTLEMVQLWVNLPARDKMTQPAYQTLLDTGIPSVSLPDEAGRVRVIAGEFAGQRGPARTHTPINVWDIRLQQSRSATLQVPDGHTAALVVLRGTVQVNGSALAREAQMVLLDRAGTEVLIEANTDATVLLLGGEPIDEPVVGYGPFVMNTQAEIQQAINDFHSGKFGQLAS